MVKIKIGDEIIQGNLTVIIRLDYKGVVKPSRFLFGSKNTEKAAEENREQKVTLLRNIPLQGIKIADIDLSADIYTVMDEKLGEEIAYAPVILTVHADTLEDIIKLIMKEEFRKIEIVEPEQLILTKYDMERLLFRVNEELSVYRENVERKFNQK
ncbi:MAG: hypothetical protein KGZ96_06330 [Clostridia bacterium]|nr:hypothetical protein [Clostridia bacterium]